MNDTNEIAEFCIKLVAQVKQLSPDEITAESTFEELAVDSLDKVNLSFDIEEQYHIDIPDSRLHTLRTVGDMIVGVKEALQLKQDKATSAPESA